MARSVLMLPYEYRREFRCLSAAAFGKLIWALMDYSMTGQEPTDLPKSAQMYWPRVQEREDRFQKEYEEKAKRLSERGKKGSDGRWHKDPEMQQASLSMHPEPKPKPNPKPYPKPKPDSSGFIPGEAELEALARLKRAKEERERKTRQAG